jgi:ABC-2 type transport system ATP-binding protein
MSAVLSASGLVKRYRAGVAPWGASIEALRGMDLELAHGELLGLLGPNGAGKSTFLLCAAGLLRPDGGTIGWFGSSRSPFGRPPGVAYVPERSLYPRFLSVREALEFYATLHELSGSERAERVRGALDRVGLAEHASKRVAHLSRGLVQRLGVAQAIIARPRLLLLDETLSGLDPVGAREMRELLAGLRDEGVSIILSSHDLISIEHVASRIVVMKDGRAHAALDPAHFTGERILVLVVDAPSAAARRLQSRRPSALLKGDELHVPLGADSPEDVLAECLAAGVGVRSSVIRRDDLEQRFFDLIERPTRVAEPNA